MWKQRSTGAAHTVIAPRSSMGYLLPLSEGFLYHYAYLTRHGEWVPVATTWRFLRLLMGWHDLRMWRIASNILNEQTRTADWGWYSTVGVRKEQKKTVCSKENKSVCYKILRRASGLKWLLGNT